MPWLDYGGSETLFGGLSLRFPAAGHRVTVIAGETGPWRDILEAQGIPVILLPAYAVKGIHSRTFRTSNLYAIVWLAWCLRRLKPDVVSACQYPTAYLSLMAARLAGVPVRIANYHNLNVLRAENPLPRFAEELAYRCMTGAVAQCQGVASVIHATEQIPLDALTVLHSGVTVPADPTASARDTRLARGYQPDDVVVGMLARFMPGKNHLHLIRALPRVLEQVPNVKVIFGGRPGPALPNVERAIQAAGLDSVVQIEPNTDPPSFLAMLDIGVLCSISEGFSFAVLEYMAYGKPVIAIQMESLAEAVIDGETGYLIAANDDDALAAALIRLARDPHLRTQFGEAGRARVQSSFTVEHELDRWLAFLDRQMADRGRR